MKTKYSIPTLTLLTILTFTISCKTSNRKIEMENPTQLKSIPLFIGTYTQNTNSEGIYLFEFNTNSGKLTQIGKTEYSENPSYLAIHPNKLWLYCVNEISSDSLNGSGGITAFKIDKNNWELKKINAVSSLGSYPCYISINNKGNFCFAANYGGGNVSAYEIDTNGRLMDQGSSFSHSGTGPHPNQNAPHAHMIIPNNNSEFFYTCDLGADKIYQYSIKLQSTTLNVLDSVPLPPGTGPRHMQFHESLPYAFVLGELNGTIQTFKLDSANGKLKPISKVYTFDTTLNTEPKSADIHIHPNGNYLYASNRGELNNIVVYAIDNITGELEYISEHSTQGEAPRNFVIDPSGKFLLVANQDSNNIVVFMIDTNTGKLEEAKIEINVPKPVCLKFYK